MFRQAFAADDHDDEVVGVAAVFDLDVVRVKRVLNVHRSHPLEQGVGCFIVAVFPRLKACQVVRLVGGVSASCAVGRVPTAQCFHVNIQLMEINVGEDGADNAALRRAGQRVMHLPKLQVACLEKLPDQVEEASIRDLSSEYLEEFGMVDVVEEPLNIAFDDPVGALAGGLDLEQCRVTASFGSEPVRRVFEHGLVDRLQQHSHHLLHQLVGE